MIEINKFNKIIVANWKLNGSFDFIEQFFENLNYNNDNSSICGVICPPSLYLQNCYRSIQNLYLGAQDCSIFEKGAFTGENSAQMLSDNHCKFCIVGHSERRMVFGEKNQNVKLKAENLIKHKIVPIICVGETIEEKLAGKTKDVLKNQIIESLPENIHNNSIIVAYEPIWSIGSGKTPLLDEIKEIHSFIKNDINNFENFKLLYGGSVNSKNASEITSLENVDGVLVGGASLDPLEFRKLLKV